MITIRVIHNSIGLELDNDLATYVDITNYSVRINPKHIDEETKNILCRKLIDILNELDNIRYDD
jgi:hypothetical protein